MAREERKHGIFLENDAIFIALSGEGEERIYIIDRASSSIEVRGEECFLNCCQVGEEAEVSVRISIYQMLYISYEFTIPIVIPDVFVSERRFIC